MIVHVRPWFFSWRVVLLRTIHVVVMTPCPSSGSTFLQLNPGASPANTSAKVLHGRRTPERMVLKLDDLLFLQNPNPQLIGPSVKKLDHGHDRSCLCALWLGQLGWQRLINPKILRLRDCIESYEETETFIRARVYHMIPSKA